MSNIVFRVAISVATVGSPMGFQCGDRCLIPEKRGFYGSTVLISARVQFSSRRLYQFDQSNQCFIMTMHSRRNGACSVNRRRPRDRVESRCVVHGSHHDNWHHAKHTRALGTETHAAGLASVAVKVRVLLGDTDCTDQP